MADDPTGFSTPTNIAWSGHVGTVEYGGGDRSQVCMFYNKAVHNPARSAEEGRPFFEDKIYVRVHPPGERLNIVDRPATQNDSRRWPMQWAQFQQQKEQTPEGTPIDLLYPELPSVAAMLRSHSVHTIEQCANLSGPAIDAVGMGAQRYTNDAKKYMEAASKGVGASQMRKELDERDSKIRTLTHQLDMLKAEVNHLREGNSSNLNLEQIQHMIAGAMARPVHMPRAPVDSQAAMINATHATADVTRQASEPRKRARAKLA